MLNRKNASIRKYYKQRKYDYVVSILFLRCANAKLQSVKLKVNAQNEILIVLTSLREKKISM